MRICPFCEKTVDIKNETCTHCDSDLTGKAYMRELMANRSTNQALLVVAIALGLLLSSFAVIVEKKPENTRTDARMTSEYVHDVGIQNEQIKQFEREMFSVHNLNHRSFTRNPTQLASPYRILNQVEANTMKNPVYKIHLRPDVYQYDQMQDLAMTLAKNHKGALVKVNFYTGLNQQNVDYGFTLTKNDTGWQVSYDHNI